MSIPTRTALWLGVAPVIFVATQASAQVVESPARPAANGNAPAQPVVSDDIVVTATKSGEQQLQKVPLAISAFSGAALETRGAVSLADVAKLTPGFNYTFNTVWAISSIRGIGTNNVFAGGDPSTTLQVDGVYYGRPTGANLDFVDVDRVEVLRGPQGTLYGRNAIGGTTNVITRDPTNELGGMVRGTLGNYALRRLEGEISVPIVSDLVSASIAGRISRRDGYIEELNPALPDQWNERREAVRGKIKITPSANLKLILAADYNHANEYYAPFNIRRSPVTPDGQDPGFFQTAQDAPDRDRMQQWGVSLRAEWDLGGATLTSITAYRHSFTTLESDLDFTELPLFHTRQFPEYQSQWSQEFNIAGKAGPVSYVAGLFGYRERVFSFYNASLFESLLITQGMTAITKSVAAFGQADYELVPGLKFTLGLRYTIDRKSAVNVDGTQSFDPPGAEGGLTSDLTQQAAGVSEIFRGVTFGGR